MNDNRAPASLLHRAGPLVTPAWVCLVIAAAITPAAWIWSHRTPTAVAPDRAQADWQRAEAVAQQEPAQPGGDWRGATGVPPAIARDEEPFLGRRNFVDQLQKNEYLSSPVRPLPAAPAQAGGSPAPRRREAQPERELSGKDCACARLDPACACLPVAPACPVARAANDEPCRYF